ncbi:hypothetical protein [Streptomyces sp. NPDC001205]
MALPDWIHGHMTPPAAPAPTPNPTREEAPAKRAHSFSAVQAAVLVTCLLATARLGYELSEHGMSVLTITTGVVFGLVSSVYAARAVERRVKYTFNCPVFGCSFSIDATTTSAGLTWLQDIALNHTHNCKAATR